MDLMTPKLYRKILWYIKSGEPERFYSLNVWRSKMRPYVLARDHYECQRCKEKGKHTRAAAVHHIVELKDDPKLALRSNNLISLCNDCHNKIHERKFNGTKNFTNPERW